MCESCFLAGAARHHCFVAQGLTLPRHSLLLETRLQRDIEARMRLAATLGEMLWQAYDGYALRPLFGVRSNTLSTAVDADASADASANVSGDVSADASARHGSVNGIVPLNEHDAFSWITYGDFGQRVKWTAAVLASIEGLQRQERALLLGDNTVAWLVIDHALILRALISVPLQPLLDDARILTVLENTGPAVALVQTRLLSRFCSMLQQLQRRGASDASRSLRTIIAFSTDLDPVRARGEEQRAIAAVLRELRPSDDGNVDVPPLAASIGDASVVSLSWLVEQEQRRQPLQQLESFESVAVHLEPDDIVTLVHTSGSTGVPKGAMMQESLLRAEMRSIRMAPEPAVFFALSPFPLASARSNLLLVLVKGARVALWSSNDVRQPLLRTHRRVVTLVLTNTTRTRWRWRWRWRWHSCSRTCAWHARRCCMLCHRSGTSCSSASSHTSLASSAMPAFRSTTPTTAKTRASKSWSRVPPTMRTIGLAVVSRYVAGHASRRNASKCI